MVYINLISSPRNISTALMYSFAQRSDTVVLDEPFYAFYLLTSGANHPGRDEVLRSQSNSEEAVKKEIFSIRNKDVVFIKNMSHHLEVMDESFVDDVVNVFFIRDPRQIIASYAQVIDKPVMRDIGVEYQFNLWQKLVDRKQDPIVLDAGNLLKAPRLVLQRLCERIGIPFEESMMKWHAGPKPYDGVWAPHWYSNVHRSTGFEPQATSSRPLPSHLEDLYQQAKALYEKLLPFSIKP
ncbi:MAG TPA: sulfotransferase family protein [Chryseolinea sp.]|nr:sulfotransferase family protein [Chryseolinea sp.]